MTEVVLRGSWGCQHCKTLKTDRGPPQKDTQNDTVRKVCPRCRHYKTDRGPPYLRMSLRHVPNLVRNSYIYIWPDIYIIIYIYIYAYIYIYTHVHIFSDVYMYIYIYSRFRVPPHTSGVHIMGGSEPGTGIIYLYLYIHIPCMI